MLKCRCGHDIIDSDVSVRKYDHANVVLHESETLVTPGCACAIDGCDCVNPEPLFVVEVKFSDKAFNQLEDLRIKTQVESMTCVISDALKLTSYLIDISKKGSKIYIKDTSGNVQELIYTR